MGDISIWITDDEAKTPVPIETEVSIGKVTAELRAVKIENEMGAASPLLKCPPASKRLSL